MIRDKSFTRMLKPDGSPLFEMARYDMGERELVTLWIGGKVYRLWRTKRQHDALGVLMTAAGCTYLNRRAA